MPRHICKLDGRYFEWSTVVDAPVTYGMTFDEFREYYREEYGRDAIDGLTRRMARVEATGTSSYLHQDPKELFSCNRAGPKETHATLQEIRAIIAPVDVSSVAEEAQ